MSRALISALALAALCLPSLAVARAAQKKITINGRPLSARDRETLAAFERTAGRATPPNDYWYDNATGAYGLWGGPTVAFIQPGLGLGGALPANASGGGNGRVTNVFVNGRELHPIDVQNLTRMLGVPVQQGRWWVDAYGNAGYEGGPVKFNLMQVARANGRSTDSYYRRGSDGDSVFVGKGCTAVSGHTGSGDSRSDYSYYVGCD